MILRNVTHNKNLRTLLPLILSLLLSSCNNSSEKIKAGWKTIDTDAFAINVPNNWEYKEEKGIDSFVGIFIVSNEERKDTLSFDFSEMGYANPLVPSETEYIEDYEWEWKPSHLFIEPGIYYTTGDIESQRKKLMKEQGITDPSQIIVKPHPKVDIRVAKEQIDSISYTYSAYLTHDVS